MPLDLLGRPTPVPFINTRPGLDPRYISSLALWFDATELSSMTLSSNAAAEWRSKTGDFSAAQTNSAWRPTLQASGINSRPALLFDGSNDFMTTNFNTSRLTGFVTYAAAVRLISFPLGGNYPPVLYARGTTTTGLNTNSNTSPQRWTVTHRNTFWDSTQGGPLALAPQRVVATVDSAGMRIRVNGASGRRASASTAGSGNNAVFQIAYDTFATARVLHAAIGEILVWSRSLTEPEMDAVDAYLASKWAIGT